MDIRKTLDTLCSMAGPSGFERAVAEQAVELMRPYVDEAAVDRFGNAIGVRLCGRPGAKKLLLDAHLDEIGPVSYTHLDVYKRQCLCPALFSGRGRQRGPHPGGHGGTAQRDSGVRPW